VLDLSAIALLDNPDLKNYQGRVSDSGEGRWTIAAAVDVAVPIPVISAALFERFESHDNADYAIVSSPPCENSLGVPWYLRSGKYLPKQPRKSWWN